jgi:hypothetical protein
MTISGDMIGLWTIYFLCIVILARSIYVYVRVPKPYTRGLIGFIAMMVVAGLWVIGITLLPQSVFIPFYLRGTPPLGFLLAIYYLTLTQGKNRFLAAVVIFVLIALAVSYIFSVIFPSW